SLIVWKVRNLASSFRRVNGGLVLKRNELEFLTFRRSKPGLVGLAAWPAQLDESTAFEINGSFSISFASLSRSHRAGAVGRRTRKRETSRRPLSKSSSSPPKTRLTQ